MALSIAELRAKVSSSQRQTSNFDSTSIFSFSKLEIGDQVRIRFVDDGEPNDFFWRTRATRTLRFDNVKLANGNIVENKAYVSVPAFNIKKGDVNLSNLPEDYLYYSNDDVINTKIKPLWDGTEEGQKLYNRFGRSERYVFQGFVRADGYETKLYRFVINKDLFNVIYSFISDDEILHTPSDPVYGRDFILKVTKKIANINGKPQEVKDYSTSKWSSNETPLTDAENAWLAENKPFVLKNFIPSRPTAEQEQVMLELFEASYNGEPYDVARWGKIFKPDNIFFDEQGNIKDMKGNKNATTTATEVPQTMVQQPDYQQPVQQFVNPMTQGEVNFMNQMQQSMTQPMTQPIPGYVHAVYQQPQQFAQPQVVMQAPVQPTVAQPVAQPTAPQLISQNTVEVSGDNPQAVINDILSKFNLQQPQG